MIEHVTSNDARLTQVNNRNLKLKHGIKMPNRVGAKQDKTSEMFHASFDRTIKAGTGGLNDCSSIGKGFKQGKLYREIQI